MTFYGYALVGGIILQLVACLMSGGDDSSWVLQACIGLAGVALMIVAFHHLANL